MYFPVMMFINMLYNVVQTFESVGEILNVTMQLKGTEQFFPVVLFFFFLFSYSCFELWHVVFGTPEKVSQKYRM